MAESFLTKWERVIMDSALRGSVKVVNRKKIPELRCDDCDNGIEADWKFCAWCGSIAHEII